MKSVLLENGENLFGRVDNAGSAASASLIKR